MRRRAPLTTAEILDYLRCICQRCGHEWIRKPQAVPKVCLKCKSMEWQMPKEKTDGAS